MINLLQFSKKYSKNLIFATIASFLIYFFDILIVNSVKLVIDQAIYESNTNLIHIILKTSVYIIFSVLIFYLFKYQMGIFKAGVLRDIREKVIGHLLKLSPDFVAKQDYGDMISRLSNEINNISEYMGTYLIDLFSLPIQLLVFSVYLFRLNPSLAFFSLLPAVIGIPIHIKLIEPVKKGQKIYVEELAKTNNNLEQLCSGIDTVKSYKLEQTLSKRYYDRLKKTLDTSFSNDKKEYLAAPFFTIITQFPMVIALCYGGYEVFKGNLTIGMLTAFITALSMLMAPLGQAFQLVIRTKMALISADRVFFIFDIKEEDNSNMIDKIIDDETVFDIQNLNYSYNETNDLALEDINLKINKGEKVAFVGRSGSGKSTMLKLLYKNFDTYSGVLKFYGIDYTVLSPNFLRKNISLISQDVFLFPMSILENIKMGNQNATYEEIVEASKLAYCHDFIIDFENGYDTMVGENGSLLSGGQKQRISIARALLKNSDIFLLDEPTSALDKTSEKFINKALANISDDKTIIVVAHRLDTITNFDKIVVFDNKNIEKVGKHSELLKEDGTYKLLYDEYIMGEVQNDR